MTITRRDIIWSTLAAPGYIECLDLGNPVMAQQRQENVGMESSPSGVVDVKRFGAKGDGITDDHDAIQSAILAADAEGGGVVYFPPGTYLLNKALLARNGVTLRGAEIYRSILKAGAAIDIVRGGNKDGSGTFVIETLTLWGYGDRGGPGDSRLVRLNNFHTVRVHRVCAMHAQDMGITIVASRVIISECEIRFTFRDAINLTGSDIVQVIGNLIERAGDDAIAVHIERGVSGSAARNGGLVIANNVIRFAFGIKCLGANYANIQGNNLRFIGGYGIAVGFDSSWSEGETDIVAVSITDNVIADVINLSMIGGGRVGSAIWLYPGTSRAGTAHSSVPPGRFDAASKRWRKPEGSWNFAGKAVGLGGSGAISIRNNIIKQTLGSAAKFSDMGYGAWWTNRGFADITPFVGTIYFAGHSKRNLVHGFQCKTGALTNLDISANLVEGCQNGAAFSDCDWLRNIKISSNIFYRVERGVIFSFTKATRVDALISDNIFDIDPFLEAEHRDVDGSWLALHSEDYSALVVAKTTNLAIISNVIKNSKKAYHTDSESEIILHQNIFIGEVGVKSRGVGSLHFPAANHMLHVEEDPRSASFLATRNPRDADEGYVEQPRDGRWMRGVLVRNSRPVVDENGSILLGWMRLTDGGNHITGIDWSALYASSIAQTNR